MPSVKDMLADARYMPVGLTPDLKTIRFGRVAVETLRAQPFLDGRSAYFKGVPVALPLDAVADEFDPAGTPCPTLLHMSFCGSTLMSHLLDIPGQSIGLREPAVQISLADAARNGAHQIEHAVSIVQALLSRPIDGHRTVVKPSNWTNNLLPLWTDSPGFDPIFLTIAPRPFLRAVFRGGRDRLAYVMRLAQHLASGVSEGASRLAGAVETPGDPLQQAARLSLLALSFQFGLFKAALAGQRWGRNRIIDFDQLTRNPTDTAIAVAAILKLPLSPGDIAAQAASVLATHAKAPGQQFAVAEETASNQTIEQLYGERFDAALRWAEAEGLPLNMAQVPSTKPRRKRSMTQSNAQDVSSHQPLLPSDSNDTQGQRPVPIIDPDR